MLSPLWMQQELKLFSLRAADTGMDIFFVRLDESDLPNDLDDRLVIGMSGNWTQGLRSLTLALEGVRFRQRMDREVPWKAPAGSNSVEAYYRAVAPTLRDAGWQDGFAWKDVVIGPSDGHAVQLTLSDMHDLIRDCRVTLRQWGGASFPCEETAATDVSRTSAGVTLVDRSPWPVAHSSSFNFWQLTANAMFMQRTDVSEDHVGRNRDVKTLAIDLALKDLCVPLIFAHRIAVRLHQARHFIVMFNWTGLSDRRIVSLHRELGEDFPETESDVFIRQVVIRKETDLHPVAQDVVRGFLRIISPDWGSGEWVADDIRLLLSGTFPR